MSGLDQGEEGGVNGARAWFPTTADPTLQVSHDGVTVSVAQICQHDEDRLLQLSTSKDPAHNVSYDNC